MKEMIKLGLTLLIISIIAAGSLAFVQGLTSGPIEEQRAQANLENQQAVFPEADAFEPIDEATLQDLQAQDENVIAVNRALSGGELVGHVVQINTGGFGGPIELMVGVRPDQSVSGMRVASHAETPGLGDKATEEEFYSQFEDKLLSPPIEVTKGQVTGNQIEALTGATVTSNYVTNGVNAVLGVMEGLGE